MGDAEIGCLLLGFEWELEKGGRVGAGGFTGVVILGFMVAGKVKVEFGDMVDINNE